MCPFMESELDDIDLAILRILMKNCKKSAREIAKELGKSPTLIAKKIRKLEELGIIKGCQAIVDYKKLGYTIMALIMLNVEGAHIEDVERTLAKEMNVRGVYDITGDFDVAILALFRDVDEMDRFVKKMLKNPFIKRSVTSVIFKAVKDNINVEL